MHRFKFTVLYCVGFVSWRDTISIPLFCTSIDVSTLQIIKNGLVI